MYLVVIVIGGLGFLFLGVKVAAEAKISEKLNPAGGHTPAMAPIDFKLKWAIHNRYN